jgi:hypothetical protein
MKYFEIPKPFKSGKCRLCHSPKFLCLGQLCDPCEEYASQDHVSNRAITMGAASPDEFIGEDDGESYWESSFHSFDPDFYRNRFQELFRDTGLSAQQRQIVKLIFCEGLTKSTISRRLEVSRSSLQNQFDRAIEKLKICRTNPVLVKERKLRAPRPKAPVNPKPKEKILPVKIFQPDENGNLRLTQIVYPKKRKPFPGGPRKRSVYQKCWRCGAKAYLADQDFYYCMDCEWNSDTCPRAKESTEEKKNSPQQQGGDAHV